MVRSLLVGLDGSPCGDSAVGLGIRWATEHNAMLVGLGVIDEPELRSPGPVPLGAGYFKQQADEARMHQARVAVDQLLERFSLRCAEAGVSSKVLEDVGTPYEQIVLEAQRYDLILLGRETRFHFATSEAPCDTLAKVIKNTPRPVVVVPERDEGRRNVLVAYDGSVQAARALHAFALSNLKMDEIHIVCIHRDGVEANRRAGRAVDFLANRGLRAAAHAVTESRPVTEVLLGEAHRHGAGLLVMGAYGQSRLRDFFLGSATRSLIAATDLPLFVYH